MDLVTVSIGVVMLLYGFYTAVMRTKTPERFGILQAMKEKFGADTGTALHIAAYTLLPVVLGVMVAFAGFNGLSLLKLFGS